MSVIKKSAIFLNSFIFLSIVTSTHTAANNEQHLYFGMDVGRSEYLYSEDNVINSEKNNAFGVHLGYRFSPYLAGELGYHYLGEFDFHRLDGMHSGDASFQLLSLSANISYPATDTLYPYIKLGVSGWLGDENGHYSEGLAPVIGAGISYRLTDHIALRMQYQFIDSMGSKEALKGVDVSLVTIGASWLFGASDSDLITNINQVTPYGTDVDPSLDVADNTTLPIISNPLLEKSVLYFGYDSFNLRDREYLNEVADYMLQVMSVSLVVEGHTDSDGNKIYNQRLSKRRALSVMEYLVSQGVDESRITPVGLGDEYPLGDNRLILGREKNRRVELRFIINQ